MTDYKKAIIEQVENGFIILELDTATDKYLSKVAEDKAAAVALLNTYFPDPPE